MNQTNDSPPTSPQRARYNVVHETHYLYQSNVTLSQQILHMTPRTFDYQSVESHHIDIDPPAHETSDMLDYFGNHSKNITISVPHQTLIVRADSTVALLPRWQWHELGGTLAWESMRDSLRDPQAAAHLFEPLQFLFESPHITCHTALADYAAPSFNPQRPLLEAVYDLMERIHHDFEFDDKATTISTPLLEVLEGRRGVCQDFAHLMIGCLRTLGLACRYVSGYILTHPPPGQPRMVGADASHAWVSVYCSGFGWIDFDPTNNRLVQNEHITLGWGRDFSDVTPMRGIVLGGGDQDLTVHVTVSPLNEAGDAPPPASGRLG